MGTDYKKCLETFCREIDCKATYHPQFGQVCIDCMLGDSTPVFLKVYRTSTGNYLGYSHIKCASQDEDPYLQAIKSILGCTLRLPEWAKVQKVKVPKTLQEFTYLYSE